MRSIFLLGGMVAVGLGSAVGAQDVDVTALQLKACGLIKDDAARVRCYDHAMGRPDSQPSLVPVSPSPGGLVSIPPAPPVAAPPIQIPASTVPSSAGGLPQTPAGPVPQAAAVPQAPAIVVPQAPGVAVAPVAPAPSVVEPPRASSQTEEGGWFGMRSVMRAITPSALTGSASSTASTWQVKADNAALQDATRLLATLESPDEKAILVLQCLNARTEAHVTIPRFLGWEGMRVRYRVNDNPPSDGVWAAAADGRGAVATDAVAFINSLVDSGTLMLRLTDYEGTNHDLRFSLGSVSGLRAQIAIVCRWPSAAPQVDEPTPPGPREARRKATSPAALGAPLKLH